MKRVRENNDVDSGSPGSPKSKLIAHFDGPPPRDPHLWKPVSTKTGDLRAIITNKKLENYAIGNTRRVFGEILRFDVIGDLKKNNPTPKTEICELDVDTYGCVRIERRRSQKPIILKFPFGPTINLIKVNNFFPNWRIEQGYGLSERKAVEIFRSATEELLDKRNNLSDELQSFLRSMERHDDKKYLFQCNHISCLFLTFSVATDEDAAIACDLIPNTSYCFFQTNMLPNRHETQHNIAYGTRLNRELHVELSNWMKTRLNLAVLAPVKYMLSNESPLRIISHGNMLVDQSIFGCCQRMRHYIAGLAIARGSNLHQGNLMILKHMDNSLTFGKERVMEKYLEHVREYSEAYTDDMRLIKTEEIYELISILDDISARFTCPDASDSDIRTLVTVGNVSRNSTIRLDKLSCDKCNMLFPNLNTLIKHFSLKQYILNKKYQCQLCTRTRCTKKDLEDHLLEFHKAKNLQGKIFSTEDSRELQQKYSSLMEMSVEEASLGYDETRIMVVKKDVLGGEQLNQIVAKSNDYNNALLIHSFSDDSSDEEVLGTKVVTNAGSDLNENPTRDDPPEDVPPETDQNLNLDGALELIQPENVSLDLQLKKSVIIADSIGPEQSFEVISSKLGAIRGVINKIIQERGISPKRNTCLNDPDETIDIETSSEKTP